MIRIYGEDRNFNLLYQLVVDNKKVGRLKLSPKKGFIKKDTVHFLIDNQILYTDMWTKYLDYLLTTLHFQLSHITKIDIAVDYEINEKNNSIIDFLKKFQYYSDNREKLNYKVNAKGRKKIISIASYKSSSTIYWGKSSSDKYIKIYNKSNELLNSNKDYILEFWRNNGLNYKSNVIERFELTLKTKLCSIIDISKLTDSDYIASLLKTHLKGYFEFSREIKRKNKIKKLNVTPINFDGFATKLLPKYKYQPKQSDRSNKILLKSLYFNMKLINLDSEDDDGNMDIKTLKDAIKVIIKSHPQLYEYYLDKKRFWDLEFNRKYSFWL